MEALEEFVSHTMQYQTIIFSEQVGYVKNPVRLSKNIFSASNFFMHIFNMSETYLQSIEKMQW